MQRFTSFVAVVASVLMFLSANPANRKLENEKEKLVAGASTSPDIKLHEIRQLPSDLEIGGDLSGVPSRTIRYVTHEDLLALPQIQFTATDDTNFVDTPRISGVALRELVERFGADPATELVIAVCDDQYRASYSRAYMATHQPVLVLTVNGRPPSGWPKDSQQHTFDMGPYMISHPKFIPSFKILSHSDEPQIPWGVVRLEFRDEKAVFGAIAPRGPHAAEAAVQAGFRIAQQNCFRCHSMGTDGGQKSGVPWAELARAAEASPEAFATYIHDPREHNPTAQMPGNPDYDAATLDALTSYFKTFAPGKMPPAEKPIRENQ